MILHFQFTVFAPCLLSNGFFQFHSRLRDMQRSYKTRQWSTPPYKPGVKVRAQAALLAQQAEARSTIVEGFRFVLGAVENFGCRTTALTIVATHVLIARGDAFVQNHPRTQSIVRRS